MMMAKNTFVTFYNAGWYFPIWHKQAIFQICKIIYKDVGRALLDEIEGASDIRTRHKGNTPFLLLIFQWVMFSNRFNLVIILSYNMHVWFFLKYSLIRKLNPKNTVISFRARKHTLKPWFANPCLWILTCNISNQK